MNNSFFSWSFSHIDRLSPFPPSVNKWQSSYWWWIWIKELADLESWSFPCTHEKMWEHGSRKAVLLLREHKMILSKEYVTVWGQKKYSYLSPGFSSFIPKIEPVLGNINTSCSAGWYQPRAFGFSGVYASWGSESSSVSDLVFNSLINPVLQFNSCFNLQSIPSGFWQYSCCC